VQQQQRAHHTTYLTLPIAQYITAKVAWLPCSLLDILPVCVSVVLLDSSPTDGRHQLRQTQLCLPVTWSAMSLAWKPRSLAFNWRSSALTYSQPWQALYHSHKALGRYGWPTTKSEVCQMSKATQCCQTSI
jgi:hypothetical protein